MTHLRILFDADDVAETLLEGWVKTLNKAADLRRAPGR